MSIQCYTCKRPRLDSISGQTGLRFLNVLDPLVSYYAQEYDLPIDETTHYVYLNGCIGAVKYYASGWWFVDVATHKNVRGKQARDSCRVLLDSFARLFYVFGYIGIMRKNHLGARVNAKWCGFFYYKDIYFNNKECEIFLRREEWVRQ